MSEASAEILFEKFEINECLKKDENSAVYLANHIYLGKKIILKVLNTEIISDSTIIERFKREAKILAKLDHPNIIKVLDFGTYGHFFYISFEYFKSENLRAVINKKSLANEQNEELLIQLFQGLNYAHQNQIIHRDIKPENILVNDSLELKISDFGLAAGLSDNFVTGKYSVVGTPGYMSPEQIQGEKLTEQSDLFSAGIVAFELFSGYNPFVGEDVNQTINRISNFHVETIAEELDRLPEKIAGLIKNLLQKQPAHRFKSAGELLNILDIKQSKVSAVISPGSATNQKKRKNKIASLIILVIVIATISAFLYFTQKDEPVSEEIAFNDEPIQSAPASFIDSGNDIKSGLEPETEQNDHIATKIVENKKKEEMSEDNLTSTGIIDEKNIIETSIGKLSVECLPWADVFVNNRKMDTTPLKDFIELNSGKHQLKLVHPDYPLYDKTIEIFPNEVTMIKVNLDTLFGYLNCRAFPWGEIYIDDKLKGETPLNNPLTLLPGEHKLKLKNPEYDDYNENILIQKNDTLVIEYNFKDNSVKQF